MDKTLWEKAVAFHGQAGFSFYNRIDGKKLRVYLKTRNNKGMDRKKRREYLLSVPVDEIFNFSEPKYALPEKARLFQTRACEICGESAPEHKMRFQDGKIVCLDCFKTYERGW